MYLVRDIIRAEHVRKHLNLPRVPAFSRDALSAAGIDDAALADIRAILESYQHTNALALVCLSAFLARFEGDEFARASAPAANRYERISAPGHRAALPRLVPITEMPPATARLVPELNGFGEDSDLTLVASMYRHLSHWPAYLALESKIRVLPESVQIVNKPGGRRRHLGDRNETWQSCTMPWSGDPFISVGRRGASARELVTLEPCEKRRKTHQREGIGVLVTLKDCADVCERRVVDSSGGERIARKRGYSR